MRSPTRLVLAVLAVALLASSAAAAPPRTEAPDEMERANRAAALLLVEHLGRVSPGDLGLLRRGPAERFVVVRGRYDHVETILARIGVRFLTVDPENLGRTSLRGVRLLLLNCPATLGAAARRRIRAFVEGGGHLLTTDWAAREILEKTFPRTVAYNGRPTRDDVVPIRVLVPDHPYLRGALRPDHAPQWWLEDRSHPIRVLDRRVQVLVDSPEMGRRYGEPAIIVTFPWRRGRVVHLVSHVHLQRSATPDAWSRRSAGAFAADLGYGPGTPVGRRLKAAGLADSARCGEVYSAYSIQRFLLNVVLESVRKRPVPRPVQPRPNPEPRPRPRGPTTEVAVDTVLRDGPAGRPVLAVAKGLRLAITARRDGWVHVRTPAGQAGWIASDEVTGR